MNSSTNRSFLIDVYRSASADSYNGGYGQGQFYLGTVSVTTDGIRQRLVRVHQQRRQLRRPIHHRHRHIGWRRHQRIQTWPCPATNKPAPSATIHRAVPVRAPTASSFTLTFQTNFSYRIQATTNLSASPIVWTDLTNYNATNISLVFTDRAATNFRVRFYRVVSP